MERKSIGQFIAALRKSSGYTQAQLAELLHVSDKAVSRWERDESAPDLSLIPVIAEIFDVTSDEILRGERLVPKTAGENPGGEQRGKKQLQRILGMAKTKFQVRSLLAGGMGVLGLLAAALCNFGFQKDHIGFVIACVFYAVGAILETAFLILAFAAVDGDGMDESRRRGFQYAAVQTARTVYGSLLVLLVATVPLANIHQGAMGCVPLNAWIVRGTGYGAVALLIWMLLCWIAEAALKCRGICAFGSEDIKKAATVRRCRLALAVLFVLTLAANGCFFRIVSPMDFVTPAVFTDPQAFIDFMEMDAYPEDGNVPNSPEYLPSQFSFRDSDGHVQQYTYTNRNSTVNQVEFETDGEGVPTAIRVYTRTDISTGRETMDRIQDYFVLTYYLEIAAVAAYYGSRRLFPGKKSVDRPGKMC